MLFAQQVSKLSIALLLTGLAPALFAEDNAESRLLHKASSYAPTSYSPIFGNTIVDQMLRAEIFEPLLRLNSLQKAVPAAAEKMTILNKGLVYRFKLRDDLFWSDGEPVIAQDYRTTLLRMADPKVVIEKLPKEQHIASLLKNGKAIISGTQPIENLGVKVLSDHLLEMELQQPLRVFDKAIANYLYPTPSHQLEKHGNDWWQIGKHLSNGPYQLTDRDNNALILKKSAYYRNSDKLFFDRVMLSAITPSDFENQLQKKTIDILFDIENNANRRWLLNKLNYSPYKIGIPAQTLLLLNTRYPALQNIHVRRAVQLATSSDKLYRRLNSYAVLCLLCAERDKSLHVQPYWASWPQQKRLNEAKELLSKAGYYAGKPLTLSLHVNNEKKLQRLANGFKDRLRKIHIDIEVVKQNTRKHYMDLLAGDYQAGLALRVNKISDPIATLALLANNENNITGWVSEPYIQLYQQISQLEDSDRRTALIKQAQQLALKEAPLITLFASSPATAQVKDDILLPPGDSYMQARNAKRVSTNSDSRN